VHTRTVTIDGDVFDPAGTLTGGNRCCLKVFFLLKDFSVKDLILLLTLGARSSSVSVLAKLEELKQAQDKLTEKSNELEKVVKELNNCKGVAEK
jgi:chromosome segregation ATPase